MWIKEHIITSSVICLMWFYFSGDLISGILFFLGSVLIDVDHIISMAILDRTVNIFKIFDTLKKINFNGLKDYEERLFCVFHTAEFIIIFAILCIYFKVLIPVLLGIIFHVFVDIFTVGWKKNKRIFFSTFFILKYLRR